LFPKWLVWKLRSDSQAAQLGWMEERCDMMIQLLVRFSALRPPTRVRGLFVYSSATPRMKLRKKIVDVFSDLLKRSGQGRGCCLWARCRELEPEITIVGRTDGDHFQGQVGERC
jgi:hypothetical protein